MTTSKIIAPLLCDFYKCVHEEQYPKEVATIVEYYTPRVSRLRNVDEVVQFGLQAFCKEYLIDYFNDNFFNRDVNEVVEEYETYLKYTLGERQGRSKKIYDLHALGYLPIEIYAVPEGKSTAIGVPQICIKNTVPGFAWVCGALETMLSTYMWHTQLSAEVGKRYRKIVDKYVDMTCSYETKAASLLGDFSMRGQHSVGSATKSSGAWLTSFLNTATVPAIEWCARNYYMDITKDKIGYGAISTEHSVMCSNYAIDGDEETFIKRLLTEIYPASNFSMVSDSYDYWHLVKDILPKLRREILEHKGTLSIRGDSGDPVEIIAGKPFIDITKDIDITEEDDGEFREFVHDLYLDNPNELIYILKFKKDCYRLTLIPEWGEERGGFTDNDYDYLAEVKYNLEKLPYGPSPEEMGTVETLWSIFGGTINVKGYKELDPHIKALYGDSITPERCEEIYKRLAVKGFAVSNVSLGVGSFSFMCLEYTDIEGEKCYYPYTRDTFGVAIKATYCETFDNKSYPIYKQPKGTSWKKSQKGCCVVKPDGKSYKDGYTWDEAMKHTNLLKLVFQNGEMKEVYTLNGVRYNMYGGKF